jgi:hypothetical protein
MFELRASKKQTPFATNSKFDAVGVEADDLASRTTCGCCARPQEFLELVEEMHIASCSDMGRWTDVRPLTHPLHWTCRGRAFQKLLLGAHRPELIEGAAHGGAAARGRQTPMYRPLPNSSDRSNEVTGGVDLAILDARVFTGDPENPWCQALAIEQGLITIESLRRAQPRRSYAATFLPPLPRRFHERNFELKFRQQKALENEAFSRACCLVAGTGFEPVTFRL